MGCMEAYGSEWKRRGVYGGVWNGEKSLWNWQSVKYVRDRKKPLTILFS